MKRVEDSLRKPLPKLEHEQLLHEQTVLKEVMAAMESGRPLGQADMTDDQIKATRSFRLLSEKPRVVIFNTADDEPQPERFTSLAAADLPVLAVPAGLELELAKMTPEDRAEFQREMGVGGADPRRADFDAPEDFRPAFVSHCRRERGPHVAVA